MWASSWPWSSSGVVPARRPRRDRRDQRPLLRRLSSGSRRAGGASCRRHGHYEHTHLVLTDVGEWAPWSQTVGDYDLARQTLAEEQRLSPAEDPRIAGWPCSGVPDGLCN